MSDDPVSISLKRSTFSSTQAANAAVSRSAGPGNSSPSDGDESTSIRHCLVVTVDVASADDLGISMDIVNVNGGVEAAARVMPSCCVSEDDSRGDRGR